MGADVNEIMQRNGRRQVWQLTAIAIGGGVATCLAIWIAQVYIQTEHDYLDDIRHSVSDVIHTVETSAGGECQALTSELLSGDAAKGTASEKLDSESDRALALLREVIETDEFHPGLDLMPKLDDASNAAGEIDKVRKQVIDWDANYTATKSALAARHREANAMLTELRLHFNDIVGQAKLAMVSRVRQLKEAGQDHQRAPVARFEAFYRLENGVLEAKADVADLLVAVERLAYGADRD